MEPTLLEIYQKKKLQKSYLIFLISCIAFYSVLYLPLYYLMASDVIWIDSPSMFLWSELVEPVMNYAFYWGSFAYVIHSSLKKGIAQSQSLIYFYIGAVCLRYASGILSYLSVMGAIHWSDFVSTDLFGLLFSMFADCLQMCAVLFILRHFLSRKKQESERVKLLLLVAAVPALTQFLSRLYFDLFNLAAPPVGPVSWVIVISYYVTDLCMAVLGAYFLHLILRLLARAETKAQNTKNQA